MKFSMLFSLAAALMPTAQALGSERWFFRPDDDSHFFMVNPITLPTQGTIETWMSFTGKDQKPESNWFISYAVPGNSDCFGNSLIGPPSGEIALNKWHHIMVTWDGATSKIFFNGVKKWDIMFPASPACTTSPGSLVIGQVEDNAGGGFQREIFLDTVAIYDKAWTDSEIMEQSQGNKKSQGHYSCVDTSDPNLIGLWLDDTGTDHSGNGNAAQVVPVHKWPTEGLFGSCEDTGACFHADSTVLLESGNSKRFSELNIGDVIRTSDGEGAFSFSPVLTLPHAANSEHAAFLNLTTETGKSVIMTPDHYIPKCNLDEVTASELVVGDCLITADGKETLMAVTSAEKNGVYTATTQDKFLVVDDIVASPYSKNSHPANTAGWDLSKYGMGMDLKRGKQRLVSYLKKHLRGNA